MDPVRLGRGSRPGETDPVESPAPPVTKEVRSVLYLSALWRCSLQVMIHCRSAPAAGDGPLFHQMLQTTLHSYALQKRFQKKV
ncbi:unnamed protein product [Pleuronectes platessa]|uniref:Uncharacterized protein n=1 Tax=Pleuronectes platessa TaxID=8262 RepID=A0A9N7Z3I8_PLEPL|nr:unnamed protein product [Pleuronectes platessa]